MLRSPAFHEHFATLRRELVEMDCSFGIGANTPAGSRAASTSDRTWKSPRPSRGPSFRL